VIDKLKVINMKHQCPVCYSKEISACIEIVNVPVYCNVLLKSRTQALAANKGDIELVFCEDCGHLFNAAFDPRRMDYDSDYENSLHYSQQFQKYAESLAFQLVDKYNLHNKSVVEIACGKGDFLTLLCNLGENHGIGFDPSYELGRVSDPEKTNITFIKDYYSEKYADHKADLVCCRHALEHIHWPLEFLSIVKKAIGNNDTAVFFEVPNALFTIKDMGIWDIIYEHCSYFCENSLKQVFLKAGFSVSQVQSVFGDQFLCIDASPVKEHRLQDEDQETCNKDELKSYVQAFSKKYSEKTRNWKRKLEDFTLNNLRTVIWGAGSKGVTFLNALEIQKEIEYIVDINPHKWGKFVPGTGHEVVAPEFLIDYQPDNIIVMNPMYVEEVRTMAKDMGVKAEIIVE
jgi:2-polyprenyl-3-methyl-5-hydroxy-6-metoxy-1,4-benzoquinol methylase